MLKSKIPLNKWSLGRVVRPRIADRTVPRRAFTPRGKIDKYLIGSEPVLPIVRFVEQRDEYSNPQGMQ